LTTEGFALEKITPAAGAAPADIPSQHSLLRTTPDPLTADEGVLIRLRITLFWGPNSTARHY